MMDNMRQWLREKRHRGAVRLETVAQAIAAGVFVCLFAWGNWEIARLPESEGSEGKYPEYTSLIFYLGGILSSAFLGVTLSNIWAQLSRGDSRKLRIEEINDRAVEEIRAGSQHLKRVYNSLRNLHPDMSDDQWTVAMYIIVDLMEEIDNRIIKMAEEIGKLGYDEEDFLREKRERFEKMQSVSRELQDSLRRMSDMGKSMENFETQMKSMQILGIQSYGKITEIGDDRERKQVTEYSSAQRRGSNERVDPRHGAPSAVDAPQENDGDPKGGHQDRPL